ncbi:MAG: hypothetical protein ACRYF5_10145, partial [Janthinobacterium lividum]
HPYGNYDDCQSIAARHKLMFSAGKIGFVKIHVSWNEKVLFRTPILVGVAVEFGQSRNSQHERIPVEHWPGPAAGRFVMPPPPEKIRDHADR